MVIGGNPAENHPMAFKHITRAITDTANCGLPNEAIQGARLISVDPRFTRTSSKAHVYAKMRSGTDIPFINGMISYVMNLGPASTPSTPGYNEQYVMSYSNAGFLVKETFQTPDQTGTGKFSGTYSGTNHPQLGDHTGSYTDKSSWEYCKYKAGIANEHKGVNIATDFWVAPGLANEGDCIAHPGGGCAFNKNSLTLDPLSATYIGLFRQHLFANGVIGPVGVDGLDSAQKTVWEHMYRYYVTSGWFTKQNVCACTGTDQATYDDICQLYAQTGIPGKAGTIMYAMGTTQHTVGTQNIRGYSTLQMLCGNMGVSGGGVNAQRGESNVQGSTDHCLLFHILPGYIKMPNYPAVTAGDKDFDLTNPAIGGGDPGHPGQPASYVQRNTPFKLHANELNWWGYSGTQSRFKQYVVSLMKCYWWDDPNWANWNHANLMIKRAAQQAIYDHIPKLPGNCSHISLFEAMKGGTVKGLMCIGQNPSVGGPNARLERKAFTSLKFLIVADLWETETAAFWQYDPDGNPLDDGGKAAIKTEVFLLPAACHLEKDGSVTNSSRWAQFRYKAVEPPGNNDMGSDNIPLGAKHEIWTLNALYEEILSEGGLTGGVDPANDDTPIAMLTMGNWWYTTNCGEGQTDGYADPTADFLDGEINGFDTTSGYPNKPGNFNGVLMGSFGSLKDDGTTSAGNWLYTNMYVAGVNKSMQRDNTQLPNRAPIYKNWAWDWPVNRRIIYNGASLEPCGWGGVTENSWDTTHPVLLHTGGGSWDNVTYDKDDGVGAPHGYGGHVGGAGERTPFIMKPEGHCRLHGFGLKDGPYPVHYEPLETVFYGGTNPIGGHAQLINPCSKVWHPTLIGNPGNGYRIIATTYRMTEHWQAGAQTRNLPWQCELVPDVICEMSKALARQKGIQSGDVVRIKAFGPGRKISARAVVTNRFKTYNIGGTNYHHVGIVWHFGYKGLCRGDSANVLTPHVGDANTMIPEYKAFLCKVIKV